jgi:hypothetical protein
VGEDELVAGGGADGGVAVLEPLKGDEGEPAVGLGEASGVGGAPLGEGGVLGGLGEGGEGEEEGCGGEVLEAHG